ncbi:MAG TPA: 4-hydroxythreonine-4-phosphate dehydrogenase PdxA [Thermoanaerobaculia bacterium]|nr:4-hydroxythreonine-4-phosphate dehydrogenase PdxA [Acidobacteriota bacterium]HQN39862.1 4-hydroxythreonine-4-phosphate dehydrogenase PdxA [Thermoanaerobaculia bacterium]
MTGPPVLALTQGDPAGVGPEVVFGALSSLAPGGALPLLVVEEAAVTAIRHLVPPALRERLRWLAEPPSREEIARLAPAIPVVDPVRRPRRVVPGRSGPEDAHGALAALDLGIALARAGTVDALVTAPVSKASIAAHCRPDFVGHTDYLAAACGLGSYGRDYLMAFLAPGLRVALLTVHQPLAEAVAALDGESVGAALACLWRHGGGGRIAVAGLNPHAGEGGLLGREEEEILAPAVAAARGRGIDVYGPESADSLFARARQGEFDWVLALYHDQGLIAVKTAAFGRATNWTLGLPFLRTSVDHGTAFALAGTGRADAAPMAAVLATTLELLATRA